MMSTSTPPTSPPLVASSSVLSAAVTNTDEKGHEQAYALQDNLFVSYMRENEQPLPEADQYDDDDDHEEEEIAVAGPAVPLPIEQV